MENLWDVVISMVGLRTLKVRFVVDDLRRRADWDPSGRIEILMKKGMEEVRGLRWFGLEVASMGIKLAEWDVGELEMRAREVMCGTG